MTKIGRNDKCPCGSGKKYKRCCLGKEVTLAPSESMTKFRHLTYEEVDEMGTEDIIARLKEMGIPFNKEKFLNDVKRSYSAEEISERWFKNFQITAQGRDEDFPWFAAWILWERLAPQGHLSMEQLDELYQLGFDYLDQKNPVSACDIWLNMWEALKARNKPVFQNLDYLDEKYKSAFFVRNFCQDLELELMNAGARDSSYFEKRIKYCREFCSIFPNESELIIHNMRRAIGESYGRLSQYEEAISEFQNLVRDFPDNPWSYIAWGDLYLFIQKDNYDQANKQYAKAMEVAEDRGDVLAVKERFASLKRLL